MRAAVVGLGDIAAVHLRALQAVGIEVAAVADVDEERAGRHATSAGARAFTDVSTMLTASDVDIDVVHVCTPHDQHLPVVQAAVAAGRAVLMEKPLAHTLAAAEAVDALGSEPGARIGVCLQNRYNPTSQALHRLIQGGTLGAVLGAHATVPWSRTASYYRAKRWAGQRARSGGGVLINQAIHTIDLLHWLLGPVEQVRGYADILSPLEGVDVEDTASVVLSHRGGLRSTLLATNTLTANHPVTIDVTFEHGSALLHSDLRITGSDGATRTVTDTPAHGDAPAYWGRSHEVLIEDFYACLRAREPFWLGPAEALASQRILDAVYSRSGMTVTG